MIGSPVKIGYSSSPHLRRSYLQQTLGVRLEILMLLPGGRATEAFMHHKCSAYRLHGEWFSRDAIAVGIAYADILCHPTSEHAVAALAAEH
jgi:hypothetical protein